MSSPSTTAVRFDAVLFDAGGVLVLPDPTVVAPLLAPYGGATDIETHCRAHYRAMAHKSLHGSVEHDWLGYNDVYVEVVGVGQGYREHAAELLERTRSALLWRWPIADTCTALAQLAAADVPMGVVSNASGQVEAELVRTGICQRGPGVGVEMRCVIDSHVVGFTKPDPRIFDVALEHFPEFERERILYIGDSVRMDIDGAGAAGLSAVLMDPYDDHADADFERVRSVADILPMLGVN
jgi:putative hydrolase of the HAD superfamily